MSKNDSSVDYSKHPKELQDVLRTRDQLAAIFTERGASPESREIVALIVAGIFASGFILAHAEGSDGDASAWMNAITSHGV